MTLSPFEVERREFGRTAMGYKTREVDSFVDEVHRSLAQLWQERSDQREELERIRERLARFEQMEEQLKSTLLLAQDSAEKAHEQARRESDLIMREAGHKARDIVHGAHEEKQRLEMVLRDLHSAEQEARQRMRSLAQTVLSHLDDTEQLVGDGATTLRAIVQAQPEVTELRSGMTGQQPRVTTPVEAELQPVVVPTPDEPVLRSERTAALRHMATSEAADAFFDSPPEFDPGVVAPRTAMTPPAASPVDEEPGVPTTFADL